MSLQSILNLTHPTEVVKSLKTTAKVVYTEGMAIPDNNENLEEEKAMWMTWWECALVCGCAIQIVDRTDTLD